MRRGSEKSGRVRTSVPQDVECLEVHFGKPVVARVRKCRLVVVKGKRAQDDEDPPRMDGC